MRILVYPHDLDMGGSQMNAIELAAAVRDLGHECVIYGRPGVLCERIEELGLEFIESPDPGKRPSARIVRDLRRLVRSRGFDVIHGYEWPTGLEAYLATLRRGTSRAMCTIMSMAVAPFLPRSLPLVVGTQQIAAHEMALGRVAVEVIEPPVDLRHNVAPDSETLDEFRTRWGVGDVPLVVCVSRLADELKAEGILTAIDVVASLPHDRPCQLLIVGDGAARERIARAAKLANRATARNTVVLTGELADPRAAYAVADVSLGMGGSALRALAFEKPLIVQGEHGYFQTLAPDSVGEFRWQGWYGVGDDIETGKSRLEGELVPLLQSGALRTRLAAFGRSTVEEFSLASAAAKQVAAYRGMSASRSIARRGSELMSTGSSLLAYKVRRRADRLRGSRRRDDFNALPVAARSDRADERRPGSRAAGPIVYFPGVDWDAVAGTDLHLATALGRLRDVIWVDPPASMLRGSATPSGESSPVPGVTRLHSHGPPGVSRPVLRDLARYVQTRALRSHLRRRALTPSAIVTTGSEPTLAAARGLPGAKVYFATDDFVEAADLWGMSKAHLARHREANLAAADLVLAVTPDLAHHLRRGKTLTHWLPNGADLGRYADMAAVQVPPAVRLPEPRAGVVGQFNERTDLEILRAVAEAGISLLLVGPTSFAQASSQREFAEIVALPHAQWIDRVPVEDIPGYLKSMDVGLTAYVDSAFNRRSYPLKTAEYLAAGVPVVATRVAPMDHFDARFVRGADDAAAFVDAVKALAAESFDPRVIQASVRDHDWADRASRLLALISEET